jgi:C-terminal processing protease CtpA/Prc
VRETTPRSSFALTPGAVLLLGILTAAPATVSVARAWSQGAVYETDVKYALAELEKKCGKFFKLKNIDWAQVSAAFSKDVKAVKSDGDHLVLLTRLLARLEDGHADVRPLEKGKGVQWPKEKSRDLVEPGMQWCRSDKKLYIKRAWGDAAAAGAAPGVEIVKVDGQPSEKWLDARIRELRDTRSFSTDYQAFAFACHWGLAGVKGTTIELDLKDSAGRAAKATVKLSKSEPGAVGPVASPEGVKPLKDLAFGKTKGGNGYIHLRRAPDNLPAQLDEALTELGDVPGMILDFRGNSGGATDHDAFMGRFVPTGKSIQFGRGNTYASAGARPYGGRVVVIVDATVRSTGETLSGIFKEDGRAYMIGESPTAGMSSQKELIELPSRLFALYVSVASNKQRFNGGRGIEGIGVIPHRVVEYDRKDLASGIDTMLRVADEALAAFPQKDVPYDPKLFVK